MPASAGRRNMNRRLAAGRDRPWRLRPTARRVAQLGASTDKFHSFAVAEQHGYALLPDSAGIACIDMPGMGGVGVHWANSTLVGDPALAHPPGGHGVRAWTGRHAAAWRR